MTGREFLDTARRLTLLTAEADWRSAVSRTYYALYLECREALRRWGFVIPQRGSHREVGLRLSVPVNVDLNSIAKVFQRLSSERNRADYDLSRQAIFLVATPSINLLGDARKAIALLDAVEADPARLKQAVADIRAAFP